MLWKGSQVPQEEDEEAVAKKAIKELEIFDSQILYNFFLLIPFFQLLYFITFFYTFFYPRHLPTPTTHTHDPRPTTFSYTQHTVCAGESRALQTNWSNSLYNDVAGSRDLFSRYQCGFCHQGRKYPTQSAITFLTDSTRRDMDGRMRFFWKIQIWISESKNGFWFFFGKSKNGSWIHKAHSQDGFFGSNTNPDFRDSQSERFFGKGFEKSIFDKRFFEKINGLNLSWWRLIKF